MRRIYIFLWGIMLCAAFSVVQAQGNRTNKTIVADVMARMPAQQQGDYNKQIKDLASTGEEGIMMLVDMFQAPGKVSNAQVEYALSGLTNYVSAKGEERALATTRNTYLKALDKVNERETKAFLIRQLQLIGGDESVDVLGRYLGQEQLSGPAARALAAIGTEKATKAIQAALMRRMGTPKTQMDLILAVAEARLPIGEDLLIGMVGNGDVEMQRVVLYALSRMGSTASLKPLAAAAAVSNYTYEKTQANDAYINLLKHLVDAGQQKEVEKAANNLLKQATKAKRPATRIAALEILFSVKKGNSSKLLFTALKDADKEYRNAALAFASSTADAPLYIEVIKALAKEKDAPKIDMLNWIGREAGCPEKKSILQNLDIRFDLPANQVLANQLKSGNANVKQAAAQAIMRIGNKDYIPHIVELLTSTNQAVVAVAQQALASFLGDIDQAVARVIPQASEPGKKAGLQLLAMRKADANLTTVLEQLKSESAEVKAEALKTLKDVVVEKDFTQLCGMLESADAASVAPIQQAVIASIATQPAATRVQNLSRRMVQAGDSKKHLYYLPLATTGEAQALSAIVAGFKNGKGAAKDAAFAALLTWKGPEVADELFAVCKDKNASSYFDQALTAYIRLAADPTLTPERRQIRLRNAMEIARTDQQKNNILRQMQRLGTFQALIYAGEFLNEKPLQEAAAQAVMNIALGNKHHTGAVVRNLLEKVITVLDNPDADYQRQAIRKHLVEMPEGDGFVSLFNGKDLTGWKGLVGNPISRAKMKPADLAKAQEKADERMRQDWTVENGCIVFHETGRDNLCTEKQYGDFEMYVDWKLDSSSKEADAGIYLRGTPQVQIWDIARTNVGAQVGSGGLYNNQKNESKPSKVADNKMDEWNTFYIKMVGDRVTVILNGEKVVDDVILENYWDRKQPIFPIEQIELQAHGSKVYYRDIYLKELPRKEPFQLSAEEKKEGYKILFDGSNMHEWTGNTVDYTMADGTISLVPNKGSGGNLYTKDEYGNFVFRFEFQLTPAANNGLGIRTPLKGDAAYVGMELQILDSEHPVYKDLEIYQYHGSVYGIIPAERGHLKPTGEWNYQEVIANGDNIKITLNGHVILEGNLREATKNGTADKKEHPGLFNKKGHIGFLGHGSPVKFRNIRIKELK